MGVLSTLSADMAATVAALGHSVVQVEGRRHGSASGVVWAADGLIVTANHVLTRDDDIGVSVGDGKSNQATLVGRDPTTDLALLRIDTKELTPPAWVGAEDLRVGHLVLAIGRPGKTVRATLGIISALGDAWRTPVGGSIERYVQTDALSSPGFSGGPLVTAEGKVVGINTSGLLRDAAVTVPTNTVRQVVDELLRRGRISRGYLGVGIQPVHLPSEHARQLGQETGLLVMSVEFGSPGERAGLVLGDTIVAIGHKPVRHWDDLAASLGRELIGHVVNVRILRAGELQERSVTVGERP
jgi:S1-C subfamily serine protease